MCVCVNAARATLRTYSSLGFAAHNALQSEFSYNAKHYAPKQASKLLACPEATPEAVTRKLPGHTHTDRCLADTACGTQNFHRQKVGGEAITDSTDRAAVSSSDPCTLGSCAIPAPRLRPKARRCRNGRSLRAGGVAHPLADVDRLLKRPQRRGPWDSARARLAVRGMMPETFSLLLCVHAGSPWPSLIFIRRHAGREVAFPKAQPLRAHLDPTTIGMPLQAHLEPPDRRIVGVHVADLAVVFGLRVCMHSLHATP